MSPDPVAPLGNRPNLWLASESPRRRQLLDSVGIPFRISAPRIDEAHPNASQAAQVCVENARQKAQKVLSTTNDPQALVIAADTLVVLDQRVLAKPSSRAEATAMLGELSGRTHTVYSGVALQSFHWGNRTTVVESHVTFAILTPEQISRYVNTQEPYDKAGSYAVQGLAARFVEKVEGSYTNVMGLPLETVLRELEAMTRLPLEDWLL